MSVCSSSTDRPSARSEATINLCFVQAFDVEMGNSAGAHVMGSRRLWLAPDSPGLWALAVENRLKEIAAAQSTRFMQTLYRQTQLDATSKAGFPHVRRKRRAAIGADTYLVAMLSLKTPVRVGQLRAMAMLCPMSTEQQGATYRSGGSVHPSIVTCKQTLRFFQQFGVVAQKQFW